MVACIFLFVVPVHYFCAILNGKQTKKIEEKNEPHEKLQSYHYYCYYCYFRKQKFKIHTLNKMTIELLCFNALYLNIYNYGWSKYTL